MTDLDHMQRRLSDLESVVRDQGYRIRALEEAGARLPGKYVADENMVVQWCKCGRDLCRAPDCPSHADQKEAANRLARK